MRAARRRLTMTSRRTADTLTARFEAARPQLGAVVFVTGQPTAVMGFVVRNGRIAAIDVPADPARIARIDLGAVTS